MPHSLHFTAEELSAKVINPAQCPKTAQLPADAEAKQRECNHETRDAYPAEYVPAIE
jgi:hypothetical protein